jgi:hypothetical protein
VEFNTEKMKREINIKKGTWFEKNEKIAYMRCYSVLPEIDEIFP